MPPETDQTFTDQQIDGMARALAEDTAAARAAPKPSLRPTKIGETLELYNRTHRLGTLGACRVAAHVSSEEEVIAGTSHKVDVDRLKEDGSFAGRQHGVTVFEAMGDADRDALCARYPDDKPLTWAERPRVG